jgi:hypothetical protein
VKETLAQITAPKPRAFCAGIVLWDDKVIEAAPIVKYMKGWTRDRVRTYCARCGWKVEVIHELERGKRPGTG